MPHVDGKEAQKAASRHVQETVQKNGILRDAHTKMENVAQSEKRMAGAQMMETSVWARLTSEVDIKRTVMLAKITERSVKQGNLPLQLGDIGPFNKFDTLDTR